MKLVLLGSSGFSTPVFEFLFRQQYDIVGVYTRTPKPVGRKRILTPTPVDAWAATHGLPIHYSIRDFDPKGAEYAIVMSYGVIIPDDVLKKCKFVNVHPSDLPKYRGPAPIREMLKNGDMRSAVCLIDTVHEPDAGGVFIREPFNVDVNDTNETIQDKVSEIAIRLLLEYLSRPEMHPPVPQIGTPVVTQKISSNDVEVDPAADRMRLHNVVRAYGFARTKIAGHEVKVLKTRVDEKTGSVNILELQLPGKKPITWKDFQNGYLRP